MCVCVCVCSCSLNRGMGLKEQSKDGRRRTCDIEGVAVGV